MATVSIKNKKFNNITNVRLSYVNGGNTLAINMLDTNNKQQYVGIDLRNHRVRFEVNGDICRYESENCAYIIGNITNAVNAGNSVYLEGTLKDFESARSSVEINQNVNVEQSYKRSLEMSRRNMQNKFIVVHINGDLTTLVDEGLFGIINGNIMDCNISNTVYIKGNVNKVIAGNMIYATMGVKKSPERIKAERMQRRRQKQAEKEFLNILNNSFDEIFGLKNN